MAEKHRDQTRREDLRKRHSGARTPCFHSVASKYGKTDLREADRQIAFICVCV